MRQTFGGIPRFVLQRRIVFDYAGDDFEECDAAGERIGGSLEYVGRSQPGIDDFLRGFGAVEGRGDGFAVRRGGKVLDDEIENGRASDIVQTGGAHYGEDSPVSNGVSQSIDDVLYGQRTLSEELLEQRIVAFGDHFHERFVRGFSRIGKIGWDFALFALAVAIGREGNRLHANEIDDALEISCGTDGDRDGHRSAPEYALHVLQGALAIGAVAVQAIEHDGAREIELIGEAPDLFRLHFDAGDAVHQHERSVGGG